MSRNYPTLSNSNIIHYGGIQLRRRREQEARGYTLYRS